MAVKGKSSFLSDGGEMGRLIQAYDWSKTPVGSIDTWPVSLRTAMRLMISSRFPMLLFWGKDLITFYNDAFRPSLGNDGKHPSSLGQRGEESWAESWPVIGPMIHNIMAGGDAVWFEDQKLPLYRDGKMGYAYWTYSFSPVDNDEGEVSGILVTCMETTKTVEGVHRLEESEHRFRNLVEKALFPVCILKGEHMVLEMGNEPLLKIWQTDDSAIGKPLLQILPEMADQPIMGWLLDVYRNGTTLNLKEIPARFERKSGKVEVCYFNFVYQPYRDADGKISGVVAMATDVTDHVLNRLRLEESRRQLLSLFEQSPVGIAVIEKSNLTFRLANSFYGKLVDRKLEEIIDKPLLEALPEIAGQGFDKLLEEVIATGVPFVSPEIPVVIKRGDGLETIHVNVAYQPMREADGSISGVLVVATDLTHPVQARQKIEETAKKLNTLIQSAPVAIGLFIGRDLIIETPNETFIEIVGRGPDIAGKSLRTVMPELESQPFLQILDDVFTGGETFKMYGAKLLIQREGEMLERYFDVTFSPIFDEHGTVTSILDISVDVTDQVLNRRQLEESELRFRSLIEEAPMATCLFTGPELTIAVANQPMLASWGKTEAVLGKPLRAAMPELEGQPFFDILNRVYTTGETFTDTEAPAVVEVDGKPVTYYFNYTLKALRNEVGEIYGIINTNVNITEQVAAKQKVAASEVKLRSIVETAPAAIGLFVGRDLIIENPNQTFIDIVGKGWGVVGLPLREAMPELVSEGQPFLKLLDDVFTTSIPFISSGSLVKIVQNGVMTNRYYNISYSPVFDAEGKVYAILDVAIDVTEQIIAQKRVEESELFVRSIFENSPVAKVVFTGEDMVIRTINQKMLQMLGRDDTIIGKPLMDAVPELHTTSLLDRLRHLYETGETYIQPEEKIMLMKDGQPYIGYYHYINKALRNTTGEIYGIISTATEITQQVEARKKIEEAERALRDAIELAELATWRVDLSTKQVSYSNRMQEWVGRRAGVMEAEGSASIHEKDRKRIHSAVLKAMERDSKGYFDEIYTIVNQQTGKERIIHASGSTVYDEKGLAVALTGTAQDITVQKNLQLALEAEVAMQTEELAQAVKDLAQTNDKLELSNKELLRSNEELSQYAYVASHDLQEPLRKIRLFSGQLGTRQQSAEQQEAIIEKIHRSTERMSLLISDLLEFSQLLKSNALMRPINLKAVVQDVVEDFELLIAEKEATIILGALPVIEGVALQMNQLFYNLIGNALKFTKKDNRPVITISSREATEEEITLHIEKRIRGTLYHHIKVEDNGIGFEPVHLERIFEVFKRLHGRHEYSGSGIGLAISRRVAQNHQGKIYAEAEPGRGARFHILLPAVQLYREAGLPEEFVWKED